MNSDNRSNLTTDNFISDFNRTLDSSSVLPAQLAKNYKIVSCIKETPERSVYLLTDNNNENYILKTGKDKLSAALWQEYHIYEQLSKHEELPVPKCISCVEIENTCYLVTSYIKGLNLVQYQEKYAPISEQTALGLMIKICRIIQILHSENPPVIHRDIKPENFILDESTGKLYLVDLDASRIFQPDKERDTMFIGTFSHAAPEQFGFSQSDVRTDIYGLGKTMLYLLTGDTDTDKLTEYNISKHFQKIIQKCIEFNPDKRYADIRQLLRALNGKQQKRKTILLCVSMVVCALICFFLGFGIGYSTGKTEGGEAPQNDAAAHSLHEQAGVGKFDFTNYKEYLDAIVLAYYADDKQALAKDCEQLIIALQKDKELNRVTGLDRSKLDEKEAEKYDGMDMFSELRSQLAYKDGAPYRIIGHYDEYAEYLYIVFSYDLVSADAGSPIYSYAAGEGYFGSDEYGTLQSALVNAVVCINIAYDKYESEQAGQP